MKSAVEAFVSNIPFALLAKDVVEYFTDKLLKLGENLSDKKLHCLCIVFYSNSGIRPKGRSSVLKCQIILKNGRHGGCALVLFETMECLQTLIAKSSTLFAGQPPRLMNIKQGDGRSSSQWTAKSHHATRFCDVQTMELAIPGAQDDLTTPINVLWTTNECTQLELRPHMRCLVVKFQVPRRLKLAKSPVMMLQISLKKIRRVWLGKDNSNDNIILAISIKHPPRLYSQKISIRTLVNVIARGTQTNFLWDMCDDSISEINDVDDEESYDRTIDPTTEGSFGRALLYRFVLGVLSPGALSKLIRDLQYFSLLKPGTTVSIVPFGPSIYIPSQLRQQQQQQQQQSNFQKICNSLLLGGCPLEPSLDHVVLAEVWNALSAARVSFSTCYLLHCLHSSNKLDLPTWMGSEDFSVMLHLMVSQKPVARVNNVLRDLFYDETTHFLRALYPYFTKQDLSIEGDKIEGDEGDFDGDLDTVEGVAAEDSLETMVIMRALITPLRICPQPAVHEQSNRVIRHFHAHRERFLRVTFVDENFGSILGASSPDIFENRLFVIMTNGIEIAGRRFIFLAFSNSQIREQSCWFYDETSPSTTGSDFPTAKYIRDWIGDLSSIRIIGKYAARLGQGFSTTFPVATFSKRQICQIPDVKRNGLCFSDGVGVISLSCARKASLEMGLRFTPSAFQIRFGGGKGMLTVMPDEFMTRMSSVICEIAFRESMMKFPSSHSQLEINSYAKRMPMFLNRQLILLLSTRGIRDSVFLDLLQEMIGAFDEALMDNESAMLFIQRYSDFDFSENSQSLWAGAWHLLAAGVQIRGDMYLYGLVSAIRNTLLSELQIKSRIFVKDAVCLIGVMDETNTLRSGEVFLQISAQKRGDPPRTFEDGRVMLVGRNPSLHPGDLRLLKVRNDPALKHLVDVVVFPALGARPHSDEMSGGDLDGDIYFAIWDANLLPTTDFPPADYSGGAAAVPPKSSVSEQGVTVDELARFFVDYIKNDNLGVIATAHVVFADTSGTGAACSECIQLAKLHSTAVDFVKSGIPAEVPKELKVRVYPTFMEKRNRASYVSSKVVGKIYEISKRKQVVEYGSGHKLTVDKSFLVEGFEEYLEGAVDALDDYNCRLWAIMQRYGVMDEMELLSGFVRNFSRKVCPKGGKGKDDVSKRLARDIKVLRKYYLNYFWEEFEEVFGVEVNDSSNIKESGLPLLSEEEMHGELEVDQRAPWKISSECYLNARKKAAAWYYCTYTQEVFDYKPLVSFPWIVFNVLCTNKCSN